jgi:hypothetical protein
MSYDDWLILRGLWDACGIVSSVIALRCVWKHYGRVHV